MEYIDGSDFRALVQSLMTETDRAQRDGHVDLDDVSRRLVQARTLLNARITLSEYRAAKRMHTGKAVGLDGIPFEMFKGRMVDGQLIISV